MSFDTDMQREAFGFGLAVVAVAIGLAILLVGEFYGASNAVPVGGVVALLGVTGLTGYITALDG